MLVRSWRYDSAGRDCGPLSKMLPFCLKRSTLARTGRPLSVSASARRLDRVVHVFEQESEAACDYEAENDGEGQVHGQGGADRALRHLSRFGQLDRAGGSELPGVVVHEDLREGVSDVCGQERVAVFDANTERGTVVSNHSVDDPSVERDHAVRSTTGRRSRRCAMWRLTARPPAGSRNTR